MSKYIDLKVTAWDRLTFHDHADMNKVIAALENGLSVDDICDEEYGFNYSDIMLDTEEYLTPENNDGEATIEVYTDSDIHGMPLDINEPIWTNAHTTELAKQIAQGKEIADGILHAIKNTNGQNM